MNSTSDLAAIELMMIKPGTGQGRLRWFCTPFGARGFSLGEPRVHLRLLGGLSRSMSTVKILRSSILMLSAMKEFLNGSIQGFLLLQAIYSMNVSQVRQVSTQKA